MLRKAGLPAQAGDAGKMISMLDKDHDGIISYQEFCRFCCLLPSAQVCIPQDPLKISIRIAVPSKIIIINVCKLLGS